jgi:hypothetical protein
MMNNQKVLVANNYIAIPVSNVALDSAVAQDISLVTTIVSNMAYYGFVPSMEAVEALQKLNKDELAAFWKSTEATLKELTGASKNMDDFVVYKNFPKEVLEKSQAEYWMAQILMYWGLPNEIFTQKAEDREPMLEKMKLKVLALAKDNALEKIFSSLKTNTARWSDVQTDHAKYLVGALKVKTVNVDEFIFKENGIVLANQLLKSAMPMDLPQTVLATALKNKGITPKSPVLKDIVDVKMSNATDVLRLAAAMSEGDVSLREKVRFKKFKRNERKFLLEILENTKNLVEDCTLRPEVWKKLLAALHPGDYKFEKVQKAYDILYRGDFTTFNGQVDANVKKLDVSALKLLQTRPGEFVRKLHHMYSLYEMKAVEAFIPVIEKLKTIQLLKLDSYVLTVNNRNQFIYPPKGNWTKAQFAMNKKKPFSSEAVSALHKAISDELAKRLNGKFPNGVDLDLNVDNIKLQTNDQKLASYGRGTVFSIPENMKFIRTASYWANQSYGNTWFDNGWNFFDENWNSVFTCCWDSTSHIDSGAVFSGDPTNSKDMKGRACQMIDLYLDKLQAAGVRYAVWNVLCYSGVPFDKADDVLATLQWGEEPQAGKLFEPSRAQMVFPLKGASKTKYVAYIDVVERKLVYMDANFSGSVHSATNNAAGLSQKMPAFVEYLKSLPSVADLFSHAQKGSMPVWFEDEGKSIEVDGKAFVFKPVNPENKFTQVDLSEILE